MTPPTLSETAPNRLTDPIAITGIGVLTPLGDSLPSLFQALLDGKRAIAPIAAPLAEEGIGGEARIADFDATRYANVRGMRLYPRGTRLGIAATKLALNDAGLGDAAATLGASLGVVSATGGSYLETVIEYDRGLVTVGPQHVNPALMPLGIPSAPGAAIALGFGAKAFSVTLANGGTSGLDALAHGARLLAAGRAATCVVVGAFTPAAEATLSAFRAGLLAPADAFRVLDRRRRGTAFGEAGVAIVLEPLSAARGRGADVRAIMSGFGATFAGPAGDAGAVERALGRACGKALKAGGRAATEISIVSAGANGAVAGDRAEASALARLLGDAAARTPLIAVKGSLGDTVDASGLVQAVVAMAAIRERIAPPITALEDPEIAGLGYALGRRPVSGSCALVTARSETGACAALVLAEDEKRTKGT